MKKKINLGHFLYDCIRAVLKFFLQKQNLDISYNFICRGQWIPMANVVV